MVFHSLKRFLPQNLNSEYYISYISLKSRNVRNVMLNHSILTQEDQDRRVTCNIRSICNDHAGITEPSAGTLQALQFSDISYILQGFLPQLFTTTFLTFLRKVRNVMLRVEVLVN